MYMKYQCNVEDRPTDDRSWKSLGGKSLNGRISITVPYRRGDNLYNN